MPFEGIALSPDGCTVAVVRDEGTPAVGLADRRALERRGESAVRWLDLPNAGVVTFSPDGSALMTYHPHTVENGIGWNIYRYELRTGAVRVTTLPVTGWGGIPRWAGDSKRYLVTVDDQEAPQGPGRLRYANPDGTLGDIFIAEGGVIGQYSPTGDWVIIDPPLPFADGAPAAWKTAKVVDVHTGQIVNRIPSAAPVLVVPTTSPLLGWYDSTHVVRFAPDTEQTTIEVVDICTLVVVKRVPAPGIGPLTYIELRSTAPLRGTAKRFGF